MAEIIWNPSKIEVPQNSAVLLCGAQNSGKSTFATNHFEKSMILSSDEIFLEVVRKNFKNVFATDESVGFEAENLLQENISNMSGKIMVLDQISPSFNQRINAINIIKKSFDNIVLIVFAIDIKELLSRPTKPIEPEKAKFHFYSPTKDVVLLTALTVIEQVRSEQICAKTNETFVFTSSKSASDCKVHF